MFVLLETHDEVRKAEQTLVSFFRQAFKNKRTKNIGYPGGTIFDQEIHTDGHYWFWSRNSAQSSKMLNFFGIYLEKKCLDITVEVNVAHEGHGKRIAGFFAQDLNSGVTYLLHTGGVGGGKPGVGKKAFLTWSNQQLVDVVDSVGSIRQGVLVMPVSPNASSRSALRYIDSIVQFKRAVRDGETETLEFKERLDQFSNFYSEPRGRRKGVRLGSVDYLSRHGDVVDALSVWRQLQGLSSGYRLVKNVFIDMGVETGNGLSEVYEVKTSVGRTNIYSAIGQLMVHGTCDDCLRFIVLPDNNEIKTDLEAAFQRLNIVLLRFRLNKTKATIVQEP